MLKVAWLSSYATKCGIAEYSKYLVTALRNRDDIELKVFGSKNYGDYDVEEAPDYVVPTFGIPLWNANQDHSLDFHKILEWKPDIIHLQYECVLYDATLLAELLNAYKGPVAITYHDNCIPPDLPVGRFNLQYSHREDVGAGTGYLLPMGIENHAPVVKTFGLGRSRADIISKVCKDLGFTFESSFGEDAWQTSEQLYRWLRDSDVIVLYYDEAPAAGVSIAARVAVSTRRPVIVNNTTWFRDLITEAPLNLYVVDTPLDMQIILRNLMYNEYIEEASWDNVATILVDDYKSCLLVS
jgi:hypothetical protein